MSSRTGFGRRFLSLCAMATAVVCLTGFSRVSRAEQPVKIGYFDMKQIFAEANEAVDIKKRLQTDFDKKQAELNKRKDEIDQLKKELDEKSAVLSPSALQSQGAELSKKVKDAQDLYVKLQQDLQTQEQQAMGELLGQLNPIVQQIINEDGYTYIFEKNEAGLFYGPPEHDLTAELLRKVNASYSKRGSTPSKPAGKGK